MFLFPDSHWQLHAHYYPPLLRSASVCNDLQLKCPKPSNSFVPDNFVDYNYDTLFPQFCVNFQYSENTRQLSSPPSLQISSKLMMTTKYQSNVLQLMSRSAVFWTFCFSRAARFLEVHVTYWSHDYSHARYATSFSLTILARTTMKQKN